MEEDPFGLNILPSMCPAVKRLIVKGSPSPSLLQLFGSTVTMFEFTAQQVPQASIERLQELLPLLRELAINEYYEVGKLPDQLEAPAPYNLSKLTCVRHLNVPHLAICSAAAWASFPPNLRRLSCAGVQCAPQSSASFAQLTTLDLLKCGGMVDTAGLAGLFRLAPCLRRVNSPWQTLNLSSLEASELVYDTDISKLADDLMLLNNRYEAGVMTSTFSILFHDYEPWQDLLKALPAGTPVFSGFTMLCLGMGFVTSAHGSIDLLQLLSAVFPNLKELTLMNSNYLDDEMLMSLLQLKKLKCLALWRCPRVTAQGLTFLVCQLPVLEALSCHFLSGVSEAEAQLLQTMMRSSGKHVAVTFSPIYIALLSSPDSE